MDELITVLPWVFSFITVVMAVYAMVVWCKVLAGYPTAVTPEFVRGTHDRLQAIESLKEDLRKATSDIVATSNSDSDWLWSEVENELGQLAKKGIKLTFIVSSSPCHRLRYVTLSKLSEQRLVSLVQLDRCPEVEWRLIDGECFHISQPDLKKSPSGQVTYWRTSGLGNQRHVRRRVHALVNSYLQSATIQAQSVMQTLGS